MARGPLTSDRPDDSSGPEQGGRAPSAHGGEPGDGARPFVAREEELARLLAAVQRARAGGPTAVLVAADAGVGKTRLVQHVGNLAQADGALVVITHCVDLGDVGLPYLPFAEALGRLREVDPAGVAAVEAHRPALARLLGVVDDDSDERSGRLQLFEGFADVLAAAGTAERPLVLVLEDMHWADASSRDLLRFLVSRLRDQHLVVVATYRTDDLHRRHPWRPLAAELVRHPRVQRLELAPFTDDELRAFTTAVTGRSVPEATLRRVIDRSEGNAYFAEELLEAGADQDQLPWSLADVLRARVEVLDPAVQQLARVASVAGRRVLEPLLRAAVAADGHPSLTAPGALDEALREAVAHHVLAVEDGHLAFRHALLGEAVASDLLPGERSALHRAYLDVLRADPSLGPASLLASHALRAPDLSVALSASMDAASQAHDVLAPAEELRHLEVVLRLWASVLPAPDQLGADEVDVLVQAAAAASAAGIVDRAVQLARAAVEHTVEPLRQAALRTGLARHLLDAERLYDALGEVSLALATIPDDPSAERAWALATLARVNLNIGRDDEAFETATQAVTSARASGAAGAESDAMTSLAVLSDDTERSADLLRKAATLARSTGDWVTELRTAFNLTSTLYYAGDLEAAARMASEGLDRAQRTGLAGSVYAGELAGFTELIRYVSGDLSPGRPLPLPPDRADDGAPTVVVVAPFYAAAARGDDDVVDRGLAFEAHWWRDGLIALVTGGCTADALTALGRAEEAFDLAGRTIAHLERTWSPLFPGGIWLGALQLAALADLAAEDRLAGRDVAARLDAGRAVMELVESTGRHGRARGGPMGPEGRAWWARARAEHGRLLGAPANDPEAWRLATREFDWGYRYEVARSRYRLAESLVEHGERAEATTEAERALLEADAMGAAPLAAAVRGLSRRARLGLPGVRTGGDVLTAREAEVLTLVAQGLSNRQIGDSLYISGKTVSVHISNLLAKLGASGRAEAVSVAHRRGLIGG